MIQEITENLSLHSTFSMNSPISSPIARGLENATVQLDLRTMDPSIGRVKEAPVCVDASLKQEAMSTEELAKFSFPKDLTRMRKNSFCAEADHEPSVVSSSSSTGSRESAISDLDGKHIWTTPLKLERRQSTHINQKVTNQKTSRSGRQSQKWHTDPVTQRKYRMVTGCVPIVEGGKVLLVSASRKPEWILPKGGWEMDEGIEESAIRECFEEAGVLGVLGPRLSHYDFETRKAKKRRLEFEENQKKKQRASGDSDHSEALSEFQESDVLQVKLVSGTDSGSFCADSILMHQSGKPLHSDETSSVASDSSLLHTHVRLSLFVLYVSDVKSSWPESGRSRKVVDIDEAIKICESRPEFHAALMEVKERNLHHLPEHEKRRLAEI